MNKWYRRLGQKGMTLIEIMIVITILGLIMTLVGSRVYKQFARAKIKTTRLGIQQVVQALTEYQMDHRKLPDAGEGLDSLKGDYMETIPNDGWGNALIYVTPGPEGMKFDVVSAGPDEAEGTDDDIRYSDIKNEQ